MLWGIGLKFCFTNKETSEGCESSIKLTLTADISSYIYQFWKVRTVLKSSEPKFFKTVLWKEKRPKNDGVTAIFF